MLSLEKLGELQRTLAEQDVLSVYIAADEHDPTERSSWRRRLDAQLDAIEESLDRDVRKPFSAARALLAGELEPYRGFLPGRGWVAFVTPEHVALCAEVPAPMPDLVRWRHGAFVAPYLRALRQNRPILAVIVDSRRARVLRYVAGRLTEDTSHRADTFIDDLTDRNMSKRAATATGVRGETATDTADRIQRMEMERLIKQVADEVHDAVAGETLVVLGGPTTAVAALQKLLSADAGDRLVVQETLNFVMTPAQIQEIVEREASALTQRLHTALVQDVLDRAGPGGRSVLRAHETAKACRMSQVARLLLSTDFITTNGDEAETLIALALAQGGAVELISGDAGALLDRAGGGVGAQLRFVPAKSATEPSVTSA